MTRPDRHRLGSVATGYHLEEGHGTQGCHVVARDVLDCRRRPLLLLRATALARADGRHLAHPRHGGADRRRGLDRPGRAAGGVHLAAGPQAGVRHAAARADPADLLDRCPCAGRRADCRHRDQRDLAEPRHRGPVAVRRLRRGSRHRAPRHLRVLSVIHRRVAAATAETTQAQEREAPSQINRPPQEGRRSE